MTPVVARKEVLAGLLFVAIGAGALAVARGYRVGTATAMGPGFVPMLLAVLLIALGLGAAVQGARRGGADAVGRFPAAAAATVLGGVVLFGVLMPRLGLIPATLALVLAACLARLGRAPIEALVLALALAAVAAALFVFGLGMPFRLI